MLSIIFGLIIIVISIGWGGQCFCMAKDEFVYKEYGFALVFFLLGLLVIALGISFILEYFIPHILGKII